MTLWPLRHVSLSSQWDLQRRLRRSKVVDIYIYIHTYIRIIYHLYVLV